jgi:hypothetical protein
MPPITPAVHDRVASVSVSWTDDGTVLELNGRMTRQLLDHARELVFTQMKPATCLTVRVRDTRMTRDLLTMLIAIRRHLARDGSVVRIDDPGDALGLEADADGRLLPARRSA